MHSFSVGRFIPQSRAILILTAGVFLLRSDSFAQQSTYSASEERMLLYVNNQYAYARKYDSLEMIGSTLDSCRRFLQSYPHSFARAGVFSYMFEMSSFVNSDTTELYPLLDSVLSYDHTPVTEFGLGEVLIERNIDRKRGEELLRAAYPFLTAPYHRYKSNLLMGRMALDRGDRVAARACFEQALAEDSTRVEGWYEYGCFLKATEQTGELARVQKRLRSLEEDHRLKYGTHVETSPLLNRNFSEYSLQDVNGSTVDFRRFLGRPVIAQCFSLWCPPKEEYPVLRDISKEYPGVTVILINGGDTPEEVRSRYLMAPGYGFLRNQTIVFGDSAITRGLFGGRTLSGTILLIDASGRIRADFPGYNKDLKSVLRKKLRQILKTH